MFRHALRGIIAGAAGTVALNVATYADMAIRGRPSSNAPAKMIGTVANNLGLTTQEQEAQHQRIQNRESGMGALSGYVVGLGIGALYGLLNPLVKHVPASLAGPLVGAAAMATSEVPLVKLQISNPKEWGLSGWAADAIPHLIYGIVTVRTYQALTTESHAYVRSRKLALIPPNLRPWIAQNSRKSDEKIPAFASRR
jgi:hypothetical protein